MKWLENRLLWGALLILAGVFFLFQTIFFPDQGGIIWSVLFILAAVLFLGYFIANRTRWWALIPGIILLDLGVMIALSSLVKGYEDSWGGAIFLGGIGLAFWLVYLVDRTNWWAIIPGGTLFTLAVVATPIAEKGLWDTGALFFLGLGLTFALVGVLPAGSTPFRMKWAFIPAAALLVMGVVIAAAATDLLEYIWPVFLILGGLILLYQTFSKRSS